LAHTRRDFHRKEISPACNIQYITTREIHWLLSFEGHFTSFARTGREFQQLALHQKGISTKLAYTREELYYIAIYIQARNFTACLLQGRNDTSFTQTYIWEISPSFFVQERNVPLKSFVFWPDSESRSCVSVGVSRSMLAYPVPRECLPVAALAKGAVEMSQCGEGILRLVLDWPHKVQSPPGY
jgi:hypothetical protein